MISFKIKGLDKAIKDLTTARKRAIPYAVRDGLNEAAFQARRLWGEEIKKTLTVRNQFTARTALEVRKATGTNLATMRSSVGSIADYMGRQEEGGTTRGKTGQLPIPGPAAAGQAAGSKRTRLVRQANYLGAIQVTKPTRAKGGRRQRNAIAIAIARKKNQKVALLQRAKGSGMALFTFNGPRGKLRTRLLWDFSKRSARVRPHPTLGPTMQQVQQRMPKLMLDAVVKQLKRHRVLGY